MRKASFWSDLRNYLIMYGEYARQEIIIRPSNASRNEHVPVTSVTSDQECLFVA